MTYCKSMRALSAPATTRINARKFVITFLRNTRMQTKKKTQ